MVLTSKMQATDLLTEVQKTYTAIRCHPKLDWKDRAVTYTDYDCFEDYVQDLCRVIQKMDDLNKIEADVVQVN